MKDTPRNSSFDLLRGLAIIGVICVHTSQVFPTGNRHIDYGLGLGRFGVQLFYFVSALTMCYMWEAREKEAGRCVKFYIRRFMRIAPLFWIAIPIYLILNGTGRTYWAPEGIKLHHVILTVFFLHGILPDSINSVVPGGWSIAVEMTFYLFFPFLITHIRNHRNFLHWALAAYFANFLITGPLIAGALEHTGFSKQLSRDFLTLNFLNQLPIFLLGCYLYFHTKAYLFKDARKVMAVFVLWVATVLVLDKIFGFPFSNVLFLIVILSIYIFVLLVVRSGFNSMLFQKLGRNSYAIYLSHFAISSVVGTILARTEVFEKGLLKFAIGVVMVTIISYLLSIASYQLIERKVHLLAQKLTR